MLFELRYYRRKDIGAEAICSKGIETLEKLWVQKLDIGTG
jgi:hypothetical protein